MLTKKKISVCIDRGSACTMIMHRPVDLSFVEAIDIWLHNRGILDI